MNRRTLLTLLSIVLVVLIALGLRWRAINLLPIDYDEDDYLRAGQQFAGAIRSGDWAAFTQLNYRTEHPPLQKIVYGVAISPLPPAPEIPDRPTTAPPATNLPRPQLLNARASGMILGSLEALLLALLNPLAGLLLAIHTWDIKYVSQVQIEALAAMASALAVLAYMRSRGRWNAWLALSSLGLGVTAASKYTYCIVGVAMVIDWFWREHRQAEAHTLRAIAPVLGRMAAWGILALAIFFLCDPYLWPDPVNRLSASLFYHIGYSQSEGVQAAGYPMWQPLVWLMGSVPWHPGVFLFALDMPVTILGAIGFPLLWRKYRVLALWLAIGLGFLLVWPTKWPQYVLTISVPLTVAAAEGLTGVIGRPLMDWARRAMGWRPRSLTDVEKRESRYALPWLLPGAIVILVITLFPLIFQGLVSLTDFNSISIKDGLNGGIAREVWKGWTGQVQPVLVSLLPNGRVSTQVVLMDRGEPHVVPFQISGLGAREVHYAGPSMLLSLLSGTGADLLLFEVIWTVFSLALQTALGVGLALVMNQQGLLLRGWWRTILILPWAIPEFVGALTWLNIFEPNHGWLSLFLGRPILWQSDPGLALAVLLLASLWLGFPLMMLASVAGLKMIPAEVYDAALVDGASSWQTLRQVTLPLLVPLLVPALIIRGIYDFNQFYLFYVMGARYPLTTFATLSFNLFNVGGAGGGGQFAASAAINMFAVIVLLIFLLVFNRQSRAVEGVAYA